MLARDPSGRLGVLDASECPPTFSFPATLVVGIIWAEIRVKSVCGESRRRTRAGRGRYESSCLRTKGCIRLHRSERRTPYVLEQSTTRARSEWKNRTSRAPFRIRSWHRRKSPSVRWWARRFVTGSMRMKAGTATKMVLDMIDNRRNGQDGNGVWKPDG